MRAKAADAAVARTSPARYPPNPVASVVLASLLILRADDRTPSPRATPPAAAPEGLTASLTAQVGLLDRP
jgi:hypothetical protein